MSTISIHKGLLIGINRKDLIPEFYRSAERPDSTRVNVDDIETRLSKKEIEALKDLACKAYNKSRSKTAAETDKWPNITKTYTDLLKISKLVQDDKGRIVSDLKTLEIALKSWVEESPQRWLFLKMKDGTLVPYLCSSIAYVPASGYRGDSAKVDLALAYEKSDGTRSLRTFTFYKSDFSREYEIEGEEKPKRRGSQGVPVATLCNYKNLYLGTKELYDEYVEQVKKFDKVRGSTGVVMVANNESMGLYSSSWSPNTLDKWMKTGKDDTLSIFITDENEEEKTTEGGYYSYFSGDSKSELAQNSSFWGTFPISFPFHPRLKCFDMSLQRHCLIHINFLEVKKFDKALGEKLVIPEKDRVYIDMLMAAASFKTEDIVAGKSGGTAIIATGPPGTGKTLTAEIYSEKVGRPLYSVQCSELGIDPEKLEKNLKMVLRRAERWNAILQLDEADVYIRARRDDIFQNAVVGVFLRVLEYFSGILFMSTNKKEEEVDDAILSRCVAILRYNRFTGDLLKRGWEVLSEQFEVPLSKADIKELMTWKNELSGRSIKTLLKNTKKYSLVMKQKPNAEMVKMVSEYSPAINVEK